MVTVFVCGICFRAVKQPLVTVFVRGTGFWEQYELLVTVFVCCACFRAVKQLLVTVFDRGAGFRVAKQILVTVFASGTGFREPIPDFGHRFCQ
ncbi:hypothetical protein [Ornithinibacillus bavariensis]|uniref:hypothetical protein n=1 Tax=Ornithinibacillus bavariensis TaxID=545502 RepID=UPI000ED4FA12|nr:hypothetical protein [Ornithinibacillus sp.]